MVIAFHHNHYNVRCRCGGLFCRKLLQSGSFGSRGIALRNLGRKMAQIAHKSSDKSRRIIELFGSAGNGRKSQSLWDRSIPQNTCHPHNHCYTCANGLEKLLFYRGLFQMKREQSNSHPHHSYPKYNHGYCGGKVHASSYSSGILCQ